MALQYSTTGVFKYIGNPDLTSSVNSNLDVWYGPYETLNDAISATVTTTDDFDPTITYQWRYKGMTVGILNENGSVTEYWFRDGIEDSDLIPKIPDIEIPQFPTIDELLSPIKIVKFHANTGDGHQNSELTDDDGWICLPAPTVTNSGNEFGGWGISPGDQNPTQAGNYYNCGLNNQTDFYAIWSDITNYTISWLPISNGTITCTANGSPISSNDQVPSNSTVVFTCTPNEGYSFGGSWQGEGIPSGVDTTANPMTIQSLSGNVSNVSCAIRQVHTVSWTNGTGYTIAAKAGPNASDLADIISGASVDHGSTVQFICTLSDGYTFGSWNGLGGTDTQSNREVTISQLSSDLNVSCNVRRNFGIKFGDLSHGHYIVNIDNGIDETVTTDSKDVVEGAEVEIRYAGQSGYTAGTWSVAYGDDTSGTPNYSESQGIISFTMPSHPLEISVTEVNGNTYTVSATVYPANSGSVSGTGSKPSGSSATVTAAAASGYHFVKWTENNADIGTANPYTFTVTGDRTLVAQFEENAPDEVNVIVLSGAKQYANTLQNRLDNNEITSTPTQITPGVEYNITVNRLLDNDTNGLVLLTPSNCIVDYIKLFDPQLDELGSNVQVRHGIPRSSSDNTLVTKFTLNGNEYDGWVKYTGDNPTTAKILLAIE